MTWTKQMDSNENNMGWPAFSAVFAIGSFFFGLLYKFIDLTFKSRREEKAEFIKAVVREAMDSSLKEIKDDIKEIKTVQAHDTKSLNNRIDTVLLEIKK